MNSNKPLLNQNSHFLKKQVYNLIKITPDKYKLQISKYPECNEPNMSNFTILYTNSDSLINKLQELQARIDSIRPKIMVVTEILPKKS